MNQETVAKEQGHQGKGKNRKRKGTQAGQNQQNQRPNKEQREAENAKKLARKIERAGQADTAVVDRRALETNAMVALIGKNDYLVDQLRKKVGFDRSININDAMNVLQLNQAIRELQSVQNALICHTLGVEYEPPRGLDVPVVDPKSVSIAELLDKVNGIISSVKKVETEQAAASEIKAT